MINFSLEKFRSSDATETFRVKNSDNVLTKSRKLEIKSSWIIRFRSFLNLKKPKNQGSRNSNFSLLNIYRSRCTCVLQILHVFTACQSYETHGRSGAPNGRGPGSLNLLNLPLLRHCKGDHSKLRGQPLQRHVSRCVQKAHGEGRV